MLALRGKQRDEYSVVGSVVTTTGASQEEEQLAGQVGTLTGAPHCSASTSSHCGPLWSTICQHYIIRTTEIINEEIINFKSSQETVQFSGGYNYLRYQ